MCRRPPPSVPCPALLCLLLLALLAGCARTSGATTSATPQTVEVRGDQLIVHGNMSFHAAYTNRYGKPVTDAEMAARPGLRSVPTIRVCLVRARGVKDFRLKGRLADDIIVGCSATDSDGNYGILIPRATCPASGCGGRYYLVTDLCSIAAKRAQTCPSLNSPIGGAYSKQPWEEKIGWRKFIWSDTYTLADQRTSHTISWNLSCPSVTGYGAPSVQCEARSMDPAGRYGSTNSNFGFNHEAIHIAVAGALVVERLGDLRPNARTTLQGHSEYCGGPRDRLSDDPWFCQDAIRLILSKAGRLGEGRSRPCTTDRPNYAPSPRAVCSSSPTNAAIVVHEIGHVLHARFMNYRGGLNSEVTTKWALGEDQKSQTGEGWANFFSAAILYARDASNPTFNGQDIERSDDRRLAGTCSATTVRGEGRVSQLFWDLYDPVSPEEPWDRFTVDLRTLLEVWSLFPGKHGKYARDRSKGECDPHGRNAWDFAHHFGRHPSDLGDIRSLLIHNCVDRHVRTMSCQ